mgnify:CR=1 FL=1
MVSNRTTEQKRKIVFFIRNPRSLPDELEVTHRQIGKNGILITGRINAENPEEALERIASAYNHSSNFEYLAVVELANVNTEGKGIKITGTLMSGIEWYNGTFWIHGKKIPREDSIYDAFRD